MSSDPTTDEKPSDFIRQMIQEDLAAGKHPTVVTRFPPEPNGYFHVGHTKAISINFSVAEEFGGRCHLRFDDTNPVAEETRFVEAIKEDIRWLGFDWGDNLFYTSDYFERLYELALVLIRGGKAFVCDLSSDELFARRGTLTEPGEESPFRDRSVEENVDLFTRMRAGEFEPGARTLRAKIDMGSSVLPMRDPLLYRILDAPHHRTGTEWPIYPIYDFAHAASDGIEGITHSLCSLEFQSRRPLYDWVLKETGFPEPRPEQTEFARLNLAHTVTSKRVLRRLVEEEVVTGWDDPRMPTIAAMRRRGYPAPAIRRFIDGTGMARRENLIELARLEFEVREFLNDAAPRAMGVIRPLKLIVDNYPDDQSEELDAIVNPQHPEQGTRPVPFSKELWIERDDFMEEPAKKFHRLAPGKEVRLRYAYLVTCTDLVKDDDGEVIEVHCTYDPETRGGDAPDGRKVKGTIHWVSAQHAVAAETRLYDVLFHQEDPRDTSEGADMLDHLNPTSLETVQAWVEPALAAAEPGHQLQLERLGYFCVDPDSRADQLVLNRTTTLRDTWAKIAKAKPKG